MAIIERFKVGDKVLFSRISNVIANHNYKTAIGDILEITNRYSISGSGGQQWYRVIGSAHYFPDDSLDFADDKSLKEWQEKNKKRIEKENKLQSMSIRHSLEHSVLTEGAGTSAFAYRYLEKGKVVDKVYHHAPCHAHFSRLPNGIIEIAENISGQKKKIDKKYHQTYNTYVKYILNESPWAHVFETKALLTALRYGILIDINQHVNVVTTGLVALRVGWEYSNKFLPSFQLFLDKGMTKGQATILASCVNLKTKQVVGQGGGHHFFSSNMDMKNMIKFFHKGYGDRYKGKPPIKNGTTVYLVSESIEKGYNKQKIDDTSILRFLTDCEGIKVKVAEWGGNEYLIEDMDAFCNSYMKRWNDEVQKLT